MIKICLYLTIVASMFFVNLAFAEVKIEDKARVFENLKFWARGLPFEQAFVCGQSEHYSATVASCKFKCNDNYCVSTCSDFPGGQPGKFKFQVEDCTKDKVHIYGENGFEAQVTKAEYEAAGDNWLIGLLKAHSHFVAPEGRVELNFSMSRTVSIISGGAKKDVQGTAVMGNIFSGNPTQGFAFEVILIPNETGLKQLAFFRADKEDIFIKRRGVLDGLR